MSLLRDLFDACEWKNKVIGALPPENETLYIWTIHEAAFAKHFFGPTGSKILTEDHPSVERSLHYGRTAAGEEVLVVREKERDIDVKEVAEGLAACMDVGKLKECLDRVKERQES